MIGPSVVHAQCRPPMDLWVCQDLYGAKGRAFLVWTNGEANYTAIRLYLKGDSAGEVAGGAGLGYIGDLSPGLHLFAVEGVCGAAASARLSANYTILTATPQLQPAGSISCSYDAVQDRLNAAIVPGSRPSLFIDVYLRRPGQGLLYVKTVAGDARTIAVSGALPDDLLRLSSSIF